jgi:hypothetical protein
MRVSKVQEKQNTRVIREFSKDQLQIEWNVFIRINRNVPLVSSVPAPTTAVLSRRKPASVAISHDSCGAKRNAL